MKRQDPAVMIERIEDLGHQQRLITDELLRAECDYIEQHAQAFAVVMLIDAEKDSSASVFGVTSEIATHAYDLRLQIGTDDERFIEREKYLTIACDASGTQTVLTVRIPGEVQFLFETPAIGRIWYLVRTFTRAKRAHAWLESKK